MFEATTRARIVDSTKVTRRKYRSKFPRPRSPNEQGSECEIAMRSSYIRTCRRTPTYERHQLHNAHVAHRFAAYRPPALYLNLSSRDSRAGFPGAEDDGVDGQGEQVSIRTLNEPGSVLLESNGVTVPFKKVR